jgi:hypothetical protein
MLLFPGQLLHAVPRPTLAWLDAAAAPTELTAPSEQQVRRVLVLNFWETHAPTDEDVSCEDDGEDNGEDGTLTAKRALQSEEEKEEEEEAVLIDEETLALLRCEPLERWQAVTGEHLATDEVMSTTPPTTTTTTTTTTLRTLAHGTDDPVVTALRASPAAVASVLGGAYQPGWIKTQPSLSTDVTGTDGVDATAGAPSIAVGVPSRYGAREERSGGRY